MNEINIVIEIFTPSPAKEPVSLTEVIGNLSLCMTEGITRFVVRRGHVLEDALRATSRKNFDPNKQLKVSCDLINVYSSTETLDKLMS